MRPRFLFEVEAPMSVTLKMRFDVFKRDAFKCQYCGRTPPAVVLEVDHIIPIKSSGKNDQDNLLTSCFDCNRGKGARKLISSAPDAIAVRAAETKERIAQLKALHRYQLRLEKMQNEQVCDILGTIAGGLGEKVDEAIGWNMNGLFEEPVKTLMRRGLTKSDFGDAAAITGQRFANVTGDIDDNVHRYFCGVCWRKVARKEGGK